MEMEERSYRKNNILLVVIGIATLLVAIVSATFAYFTATITRTNETNSVIIKTATIEITYDNGNEVNVDTLMPGVTIPSKVVSIKNDTAYNAVYSLEWQANVVNTFVNKEDFTYTVTCTGTDAQSKAEAQMPAASADTQPILTLVTLPANTTHVCTFAFTYTDNLLNQNSDQGKEFSGNFEIVAESIPTP